MKKTVFDLSYDEGKKIDKELKRTSYFKQYFMGYILTILFFVIVYFVGIFMCVDCKAISEETLNIIVAIGLMLVGCFIVVSMLLFWFKRFDLAKEYYESKNK